MKKNPLYIRLPAILALITLWGCSGGDEGTPVAPDTAAPIVVSTSPADGAVNVPLDATISVTFNDEMNRFTFTQNSFFVSDGVDGIILYGNKTAIFSPDNDLLYKWEYTAVVTTAVTDAAGNHLDSNYIWTFTTTPGVIMPLAVSNKWEFIIVTQDTVAGTADTTYDDILIAGDTTIQSEKWYKTDDGQLLRNGSEGLYKMASNGQAYLFLKFPSQSGDTYTADPTISEAMEIKGTSVLVAPPNGQFFCYSYESRPADSAVLRRYFYYPNVGPIVLERAVGARLLERWSLIRFTLN